MELRSGQHLSGLPPALAASAERIRVLSRDGDMPALAALLQGARPPLACPRAACSCRALRPPPPPPPPHTHTTTPTTTTASGVGGGAGEPADPRA